MPHIQRIHRLEVGLDVAVRNILPGQILPACRRNDFVIHIREILDIANLQAVLGEIAAYYIPGHKRTRIANMGVIVGRHAAAVDAHLTGLQGLEFLFLAGQCVINFQHSRMLLFSKKPAPSLLVDAGKKLRHFWPIF